MSTIQNYLIKTAQIERKGARHYALEWGVDESSLHNWMRGRKMIRADLAYKIIVATKGEITLEGIMQPYGLVEDSAEKLVTSKSAKDEDLL